MCIFIYICTRHDTLSLTSSGRLTFHQHDFDNHLFFSLPRARSLPSTGKYICVTGRTQQSLMTRTASSTEEFSLCSAQLSRREKNNEIQLCVCLGGWAGDKPCSLQFYFPPLLLLLGKLVENFTDNCVWWASFVNPRCNLSDAEIEGKGHFSHMNIEVHVLTRQRTRRTIKSWVALIDMR